MKNEIILFENQNVRLEVNMKDETVWLNQEQMSKLFGKAKSTINEHIKNIYRSEELLVEETMTKFGNSEFSDKPTNYYNLLFKDGVRVIDNNTLVAITLLIAQSNPKEKNIMIDLIMNFICNSI